MISTRGFFHSNFKGLPDSFQPNHNSQALLKREKPSINEAKNHLYAANISERREEKTTRVFVIVTSTIEITKPRIAYVSVCVFCLVFFDCSYPCFFVVVLFPQESILGTRRACLRLAHPALGWPRKNRGKKAWLFSVTYLSFFLNTPPARDRAQ